MSTPADTFGPTGGFVNGPGVVATSSTNCPLSPAPALTAEEAARVAVFDAAEEPEEIVVERVARALAEDADAGAIFDDPDLDPEMWEAYAEDRDFFHRQATAALAAMRTPR